VGKNLFSFSPERQHIIIVADFLQELVEFFIALKEWPTNLHEFTRIVTKKKVLSF